LNAAGPPAIPTGHEETVFSSGLLDNGNTICSVDNSGRLLIWDAETKERLSELSVECEKMRLATLRVSPDRKLIAVARHEFPFQSSPSVVEVIDASNRCDATVRFRLPLARGLRCTLPAVFSPNSRLVAIGSGDHVVIHSVETGKLVKELAFDHRLKSVDFSADGQWLVAGGIHQKVAVYRTVDWRLETSVDTNVKSVFAVAVAPDNSCFATAGNDGRIQLWSLPSGEPVGPHFKKIENLILNVQFSPDGRHILTTSKDGSLRIWMCESGEELLSLPLTYSWLQDGSFSPDGQSIVVGASTDVYLLRSSADELVRLSRSELEDRAYKSRIPAKTFLGVNQ
jgi:WD40 repeat protein